MPEMREARRVMVNNQIRTFDVTDRDLLTAFDTVPREVFVAPEDRKLAYLDRSVQVSAGAASRFLLPPLILARLLQALQPQAGERALDVLGGSGYSAAILAAMGLNTVAVESDPALTALAEAALKRAGSDARLLPARTLTASRAPDLREDAFDLVLINGAAEREPAAFFPLLAEGGRLGIVMRNGRAGRANVFVKSNGHVSVRRAFDSGAPLLPGFENEPAFAF